MKKFFGVAALAISALLSACGGGGGSSGDSSLDYSISLRAAKTQLPINISNEQPSTGAYARYTTTLYVEAREGGAPIPGGIDIFGCNIAQGLDSGALAYLDGDPAHKVTVKDENGNDIEIEGLYRSVVLGSNSGGNSFHFHASNQAGTARITCSVTNPADKQVHSASVDIVVGAATGKPASVIATTQAPRYLGSRDNLNLIRNNVGIQAFLMDDANQPIPDPSAANVQISIRPFASAADASAGARLLSGSQSGSVIQVRTIGGVGLISLSSGAKSGVILVEFTTDRFDNNVSNGIQDPVTSLKAVSVVDAVATKPLAITGEADLTAANGLPFAYALSAEGGVPPYAWSDAGGLPAGLTLDETGIISGTPKAPPGDYAVVVRVTDGAGVVATRNMKITITGALIEPLVFTVNGCSGDLNTACPLPDATTGTPYIYGFSATGGDATKPIVWSYAPTPLPMTLVATSAGNAGVISTNTVPAAAACYKFFVTATRDTLSATRQVSIRANGGVCP
ncbi:MAG: Ig domain-containing protein [Giesbergeria sp.]